MLRGVVPEFKLGPDRSGRGRRILGWVGDPDFFGSSIGRLVKAVNVRQDDLFAGSGVAIGRKPRIRMTCDLE